MPRGGAKPGERRGGRKKGTPNGASIIKAEEHLDIVRCTVKRVLEEYSRLAFHDISRAFNTDGSLKSIHDIPEDIRRSISGIEVVNYEEDGDGKGSIGKLHKIKIIEKTKPLDSIARHLGMFTDKVEHSGAVQIGEIEVRLIKAIDGRRAE